MASLADNDEISSPKFLIVNPKKAKLIDIVKLLVGFKSGLMSVLDSSDERLKLTAAMEQLWALRVSFIIGLILDFIERPLKLLGFLIDFFLNFLSQNGGFCGILHKLLYGNLRIPRTDSDNFLSTIGQLDGRIELYRSRILSEQVDDCVVSDISNIESSLGNRYLMDLCIMASKLAYENKNVVQKVVDTYWKMHFVGFYDCWNENQEANNTKVFICCDKPKDANLIVVSFRGTEPFNAQDWGTDFEFAWYEVQNVGKLHVGFSEAIGIGHRYDIGSFLTHLRRKNFGFFDLHVDLEPNMIELGKRSAYYIVALKLKNLLKEHQNAKFVVTGHSLGGALAILFASVLVIQEETEMLERLLNVYTFGQPRIGDAEFGSFVDSRLNRPNTKYYRVVYCNDIVPRVPFDDKFLTFKHFGTCLYYDNRFFGTFTEEEPDRNFFGLENIIPMRINAIWEILRSFAMKHTYGHDYDESWFCTFFRVLGLVLPGISAHSPVDYVNSVRLGREKYPSLSLKSFARKL